jgi:hypothetical protein
MLGEQAIDKKYLNFPSSKSVPIYTLTKSFNFPEALQILNFILNKTKEMLFTNLVSEKQSHYCFILLFFNYL